MTILSKIAVLLYFDVFQKYIKNFQFCRPLFFIVQRRGAYGALPMIWHWQRQENVHCGMMTKFWCFCSSFEAKFNDV